MSYQINLYDIVKRRHLPDLPKAVRENVFNAIETRLMTEPASYGKPLAGSLKGHRRLRVGDYRIIYRIHPGPKSVDIIAIAHRKDIYEGF